MSFQWSFMTNIRFSFDKLPGLAWLAGLMQAAPKSIQQFYIENIKRLVYCQYGQYSLAFRALALRQREKPSVLAVQQPFYISISISTIRSTIRLVILYRSRFALIKCSRSFRSISDLPAGSISVHIQVLTFRLLSTEIDLRLIFTLYYAIYSFIATVSEDSAAAIEVPSGKQNLVINVKLSRLIASF